MKRKPLQGADIYVVRYNTGSVSMSHPCKDCVMFMYDCGIKRVYFTDKTTNLDEKSEISIVCKNVIDMYFEVISGYGYKSGGCKSVENI